MVCDDGTELPLKAGDGAAEGRRVLYGVRPEHLSLVPDGLGLSTEVLVVEPTGSETQVFSQLSGQEVCAVFRERHQFKPGQPIILRPDVSHAHLFDVTSGARI